MQCLTTYDDETGLATHQASIATVTQMTDGTGIKELRDDAILFDVMDLKRLATTLRWIKSPNVLYETLEALIDEINMSSEREKFLALSRSLRDCESITVPVVHSSTNTRVVMDYVPSVLVKDRTSPIGLHLVNDFFSKMIISAFKTGVFHVDLHAGNVGYVNDGFVVYDMGSVNAIPHDEMRDLWQVLVNSSEHVFFDDWDEVSKELLKYRIVLKISDPYELKLIVENITAYSRGDIDLDAVVNTFKAVRGGVVTSTTVSRILQSVALLEGTCKAMNPDFVPYDAIKIWDVLRSGPSSIDVT
jgi:predicted unusual protein kinase regulating ubiquinone biosynthesis (AarF/ABC1/UbiB family)